MTREHHFPAMVLQQDPLIYLSKISGPWLLQHSTPSWRIRDPEKGFQRIVKEERARAIAASVLDQQRTFPNAIVLATDLKSFREHDGQIAVPPKTRFLVVDGQHRLWAQKYSTFPAHYACVLHMQSTEVEMARLFLEINDNQRRVPSSLRWDLVRLVRPQDDPSSVAAGELVYQLSTDSRSPMYQRIDLTGEQSEISLKQGSVAPELRGIVNSRLIGLRTISFDELYDLLVRYVAAVRSLDPDGWKRGESTYYKARVFRALLRLLPDLVRVLRKSPNSCTARDFVARLSRIDATTLAPERIRAVQGSAGMRAIYTIIRDQVLKSA